MLLFRPLCDAAGLVADTVAFTVEYVPTGTTATSITAEVVIPNSVLLKTKLETVGGTGVKIPVPDLTEAFAMIDAAYAGLQSGASG